MATNTHNSTRTKFASALPGHLLWVDCLGGLLSGLAMFAVCDWLRGVYGMSSWLFTSIAAANVGYGLFSLSLA